MTPDNADELAKSRPNFWKTMGTSPEFKYANTAWYALEEVIGFGGYASEAFTRLYFVDNNCSTEKQTVEAVEKLAEEKE